MPSNRQLDYELRDVQQDQPGVLPCESFRRIGRDLLFGAVQNPPPDQPSPPPVSDLMAKRLLTALAGLQNANGLALQLARSITVREFRSRSEAGQLAFVNALWKRITTAHSFNQHAAEMLDPAAAVPGHWPSSMRPNPAPAAGLGKRLGPAATPFRDLGVGFRVDGSSQADLDRIIGGGMRQQRVDRHFMHARKGMWFDGTVLDETHHARMWTLNADTFNETAVCVSRNFFGATAFPERNSEGVYYLWAVDCSGLMGFDMEAEQHARHRPWSPGEKAFMAIPRECILGWVQVTRLGPRVMGNGWDFSIAANATWNMVRYPRPTQLTYMQQELVAWRGGPHHIPPTYDFVGC